MNAVGPLDRRTAETYAAWFRALADGTRVQVVSLLARAGRPLTVKEIVAAVPVGQSTVSEHLRQLALVGFVLAEERGTSRLYRINENCVSCFPTAADLVMGKPSPVPVPVRPPIAGLGAFGPADGVHLVHSMGDTFAVMATLERAAPASALIVGGGYIGLEMADALTVRGLAVTQIEQLPEVLPTVDPELGALVHAELAGHGVEVLSGTTVRAIGMGGSSRLEVAAIAADGSAVTRTADMVLVVVGVRPETALAAEAGATLGARGAIMVDPYGDCVVTHHRLLGVTYLPLGTTAHKQGRVAGENALGGNRVFAGSLSTHLRPRRRAHRAA